jgi:hypothetical protein
VISGLHSDVDEIYPLLGYYTALSGNSVQTFRDNLLVPSSRAKKSSTLKMGHIGCPETSVQNHQTLRNIPEELRSQPLSCIFVPYLIIQPIPVPRGLRRGSTAARWFESRLRHGCLSLVSVVCGQVEISATSWSLVQRSLTECDVTKCVIAKP